MYLKSAKNAHFSVKLWVVSPSFLRCSFVNPPLLVRFFIIYVKENDAWKGGGIAEEDMCGIVILCKYIL